MSPRRRVHRPQGAPGEQRPLTGAPETSDEPEPQQRPGAESEDPAPDGNDERLRREVPPHW